MGLAQAARRPLTGGTFMERQHGKQAHSGFSWAYLCAPLQKIRCHECDWKCRVVPVPQAGSARRESPGRIRCEALNLPVAGVDIIRSNKGQLLLEVNSSPGLEGIERATGIANAMIQAI